jgi:hypothetical protein
MPGPGFAHGLELGEKYPDLPYPSILELRSRRIRSSISVVISLCDSDEAGSIGVHPKWKTENFFAGIQESDPSPLLPSS